MNNSIRTQATRSKQGMEEQTFGKIEAWAT
jgi:hypothetical protein